MKPTLSSLLALIGLLLIGCGVEPLPRYKAPDAATRTDALFAQWDDSRSPGAAITIEIDGEVVYRKAFGLADLESRSPLTPSTVLEGGGLGQQMTAFAVLLLAHRGELSLDDEAQTYLPGLADFGTPITLRHLLHHTSGLRSYRYLFALGGKRGIQSQDSALKLLRDQRSLDFSTGRGHLPSATNYLLLAEIVEKVSGRSFQDFTRAEIFDPLEMSQTRFRGPEGSGSEPPAPSYRPAPPSRLDRLLGRDRFEALQDVHQSWGAGGLLTTVDDLMKWQRNLEDRHLAGEIVARLHEPGALADGEVVRYAGGLVVGEYRGLRIFSHSGAIMGYRSETLRIPERRLSLVMLTNLATLRSEMAYRALDAFLGVTELNDERLEVPLEDFSALKNYAGDYLAIDDLLTVEHRGNRLFFHRAGRAPTRILPLEDGSFRIRRKIYRTVPGDDGRAAYLELARGSQDIRMPRIKTVDVPVLARPSFAGKFYSEELESELRVVHRAGMLTLELPSREVQLQSVREELFVSPVGSLRYLRDDADEIEAVELSTPHLRRLRFDRR